MRRSRFVVLAVALLVVAAEAQAVPTVPGYVVTDYASISHPMYMSFDLATGSLYVGRDEDDLDGAYKIRKVASGGSPVTEYGVSPINDPDGVLFDANGAAGGPAGSVLVGGSVCTPLPCSGRITRVAPDESVTCILGCATSNFVNPSDMAFDGNGRLLFTDDRYYSGAVMVSEAGMEPTELFALGHTLKGLAIDTLNRIFTIDDQGTIRIHAADGTLINDSFATGLGTGNKETLPLEFGPGSGPWGSDLYTLSSVTGELVRISEAGVRTVIGTGFIGIYSDIKFGPDKEMYFSARDENRIFRLDPQPEAVPTLTGWGLAALVLLLLVSSCALMLKRSQAVS